MSDVTVARNYAEALFALGEESGQTELYGELLDSVASAVTTSPEIQGVLMSPRIPKSQKAQLMGAALGDAPREFVLFLQAVVRRGRQMLLGGIAEEYTGLVDAKVGRVRAGVTVAREPDEAMRAAIESELSRALGKEVVARFRVDRAILGGTIVRIGDRVYDGSLRRRMARLRRGLLAR